MNERSLAPYVADASSPFDRRRAAHLLRRAGFGVPAAELARAVDEGADRTVERLVEERDDPAVRELDAVVATLTSSAEVDGLAAWWVSRMLRTSDPLREKTALFWHGHFATSNAKVQNARQMYGQLRLFLDLGRGAFGPLLTAVAADPAMLTWLDGDRNRKGHPNENFARELLELFSLGIGHYSETDVQEAARALTGWRRAGGNYRFIASRHDEGEKTVLGERGNLGQSDVLKLCVDHAATARRLARHLLRFFAHPEPPTSVVDEAARALSEDGLHVGRFLGRVFRSRWFFSDAVIESRILSPAEFVVGHLRTLGARADAKRAAALIKRLGQALLEPPSVKGWDGERAWIHSASMIARLDAAGRLANPDGDLIKDLDPETVLAGARGDPPEDAEQLADLAASRILHRSIPAEARRAVTQLLSETDSSGRPTRAVAAILALPEASIG